MKMLRFLFVLAILAMGAMTFTACSNGGGGCGAACKGCAPDRNCCEGCRQGTGCICPR
jgi:hypothetical protein